MKRFLLSIFLFTQLSSFAQTGSHTSDSLALVDLYNSTNGIAWVNHTNWLSVSPINTWNGVSTDVNGRVTDLILYFNNLSGTIPTSIGNLTNLQTLQLGSNQLTGSIPSSVGNLVNVKIMGLDNNHLSGTIPTEIGNMVSLQELGLYTNQLTGNIPTTVGSLTHLTKLYLSDNQLSGSIPTEIGNLINLQYLQLQNNHLSGSIPSSIGNLTPLMGLIISGNQLTGSIPTSIGNLTGLTYLHLFNNQLSGSIPTEIGNLINLTELYLYSNQLSGNIPTSISNLTKLIRISLQVNQLSGSIPSSIGNLTDLQILQLFTNQLSGTIPSSIGNLINLQDVELGNNNLSGSIPTSFGNLFNLKYLRLYQNQLTGSIPSELGNINSLLELVLYTNQLTGTIPNSISNLTHLNKFDFAGNKIVSPIPLGISNLPLQGFYSYGNSLVFDGALINLTQNLSAGNLSYSPQNALYDSLDLFVNIDGSFSMQLPIAYSGTGDTAMNGLKVEWYKNGTLFQTLNRFLPANTEVTAINFTPPSGTQATDEFYAVITHPSAPLLSLVTKKATGSSGYVSGGGSGGLESKSLGDAVGNRLMGKALNNLLGPIDYSKMQLVERRSMIQTTGITTSLSLKDILPTKISGINLKAYVSTPLDIPTITNAKEVLSIDYTLNNQAKAVAFATKTTGEVYDHTKAICDRLKGSELLNMQWVQINDAKLVRYDLKNSQGQVEYAMSFVVGMKDGRSNYSIQSNWLNKDYVADETMYNIQLWSVSPTVLISMATEVLKNLNSNMPLNPVVTNSILPNTYINKVERVADNIKLSINSNNLIGANAYVEVLEKANEQSTVIAKKTIPFVITTKGISQFNVPANDSYESTINLYVNNILQDQVFMSDGSWGLNVNNSTTAVQSFKVSNDLNTGNRSKEDFAIFRNVQIQAKTSDYVSVYKLLKGGGATADLTGYKTLLFSGSAVGANVNITLVKNSIANWADQYQIRLPLSETSKDFQVSLNDFKSASNNSPIDPKDISMVVFNFEVSGGSLIDVQANLSNLSFSKSDFAYLNSLSNKEISVFPNPSNGKFTSSFKSEKSGLVNLVLTDMTSGRKISTKSVSVQMGENQVPMNVEKPSGINHYILTIEGTSGNYIPKKIIVTEK